MTGLRSDGPRNQAEDLPHPDDTSNTAMFDARYHHAHRHGVITRSLLTQAERARLDAAVLGLSDPEYRKYSDAFALRAQIAAQELLDDDTFAPALKRLPFLEGERIVALGDSITDDSCSWAEILSAVFRLTDTRVEILNHGISGDTTTGAIKRIDLVAAQSPQWVVVMLGTNDARRHGDIAQVRMVSREESLRNVDALRELIEKDVGARVVMMTPPPVLEDRLLAWSPFIRQQITWRSNEVEELAGEFTSRDSRVVNIHSAFSAKDTRALLTSDGVHPTVQGQKLIVRDLVSSF